VAAKRSAKSAADPVAAAERNGKSTVDPAEALTKYAKKRDFAKTPEPSDAPGKTKPRRGKDLRFVVQMHRASRLHWDFRLEADGVLKSWAVPKGPTLDTTEKRLAMHVEDHPLDYRDFEGIIPKGNYGAGEVIVWDRGTYRLLEGTDTTAQIAKGSLKFELFGKKLHGGFALVHIKGRDGEENAWLLIKERDDAVDPEWRIEAHAESVKSGKTVAEIAKDPRAPHWISNRPETSAHATAVRARPKAEPLPTSLAPMLATLVEAPFDDPQWLFELKWDGYRAIAYIERDGSLALVSRNGNDFSAKFPDLADLADAFSERPVIVDGEIAVLDAEGKPSFQALQERLDRFGRADPYKTPVTFVVFDLLYGNGRDLRGEPLEKRKAILESILTGRGPVLFSKHVVGEGKTLYALAQRQGLEGIMAKRRDSTYQDRRSRDWLKIKTAHRQEVVVGGWTEARGSRAHFGALLVGTYDGDDLIYNGSVGTGFDGRKLAAIAKQMEPLARTTPAFAVPPKTDTPAHWIEPKLVAEVSFAEWTRDGVMRQPVFVAMRVDKDPHEVIRERPSATETKEGPRKAPPPKAAPPNGRAPNAARPNAATQNAPLKATPPKAAASVAASANVAEPMAAPPKAAAHAAKRTTETVEIGGHSLVLSNDAKVLWPDDGYTKGDLIRYYRAVAPFLLPHLEHRPLTMQRYPDGIYAESFFEKHAPRGLPSWIETVGVPSDSGRRDEIRFIVCNDEATLVWVANLASIVLHVWTSRVESLATPEFIFFDLDPHDDCTLATLAKVALGLKDALGEIGLTPLIKSSGGSGLHVAIPLEPDYTYEVAKAFAELVARHLNGLMPDMTTLQRMPAKRPKGTVYLDYVQVGKGKTLVAAYSARPRAGAPVSMPLEWGEVEAMTRKRAKETEAEFARFTLKNAPARLAERGDLWGGAHWKRQRLEPALEKARKAWDLSGE
jgi:bifunctional non-homologous end joining protein LigD